MANTLKKPLLEVHHLQAWYGSSHILQGVDLSLASGETFGLLGRNGMGKTTLIRSILGLVPQREGSVIWQGKDISKAKIHEISMLGIAYVPEGRGIFPNLSVKENLIMAARAGSTIGAKDKTKQLWDLERILSIFPRLNERINHLGNQLSGGEQQMLSIGRALMTNPELIILDEATEGLAPLIVKEIWRIVDEIRNQGTTTLIIDRDWRKVLARSDQVMILQKGLSVLSDKANIIAEDKRLSTFLGV